MSQNTQGKSGDARFWRAHSVHIAIIFFFVVAPFWRVFILGETLVDVPTLNNQLPWGFYAEGSAPYPYNRGDLTDTYITRDYFVVDAYRDGETPLWNPYTMAGHPIYADGVTRTLSPSLLLYTLLDIPLGYSVGRILELLLAAIFTYVFLVAIGVRPTGALMGSLVFAGSAHSMFHLTGLGWWGGLMWLPLAFMFVDRAVTRAGYAGAILAGVFLALQFFSGFMPNQVYYVGAIILYYLFFVVGRGQRRGRLRIGIMMAVTLVTGFALAATQWVPVMELLGYSNRRVVPADQGFIWLPPWYGATLVFPNLFGTARDAEMLKLFSAIGVSHDHSLYLGVAALLPLGVVIAYRKAAPIRVRFFLILALLGLFIMMAAPLYVHITQFIPVAQTIRVITRAGVLFVFGASVLVAFGVDMLANCGRDQLSAIARQFRRFAAGTAAFVLLAVAASYVAKAAGLLEGVSGERPPGSGAGDFIKRAAAALSVQFTSPNAGIIIPLLALIAVSALVWLLADGRIRHRAFFTALVVLLVADLYWNSGQYNPTYDRSRVYPSTEITDLLRSLPPGRVVVAPADLESNRRVLPDEEKIIAPPNTLLPYRIPTVTGKDQLFPKSYREFCSLVEPQPNLSHVVFDQTHSPYLELLNVRYVLTHASRPPLDGYQLVATEEGISLYENRAAMPRAYFVDRVVETARGEDTLRLMAEPSFDVRTTAVIERNAKGSPATRIDGSSMKAGQARIVADHRNLVVIATDNEEGGLLVLSDNYYPGWRAMIDEAPVELLRANHTMRAVWVPRGRHVVYFEFDPAVFRISAYASICAGVAVFAVLLWYRVRRRRAEGDSE